MSTDSLNEVWEIYRVTGGMFNSPLVKTLMETASSKQEADDIVTQYRKTWTIVYCKKRVSE